MSTIAVNAITDASGGNTASINGATPTNDNLMGRNRIINGDMRIDQRNAGASVSVTSSARTYSLDRWTHRAVTSSGTFTVQQVTDSPTGFVNSIKVTIGTTASPLASTDLYYISQLVEGNNTADIGLGESWCKPISFSFWVKSSVTGTFGGSLAGSWSYPFSYTINSADTWEYKTISVPAITSGSFSTSTSSSLNCVFGLGIGSTYLGTANTWASGTYSSPTGSVNLMATSGATFYITGVQLEAGSVATSFERRHYGQELQLCKRYFQIANICCTDYGPSGYSTEQRTPFVVEMRASPTAAQGSTGSTSHFNASSNTLNVRDQRHADAQATSASTGSYSSRFLNWQFSAEL